MDLVARDAHALTLPREAVHQDDGHTFVYQVVDGKLQRTDIHTSISNLTRIEVTSGLSDGADVALSSMNGQPLRPGQPVRVVTP